jgi:hypothetical protein
MTATTAWPGRLPSGEEVDGIKRPQALSGLRALGRYCSVTLLAPAN